jgi:hypothetical protein
MQRGLQNFKELGLAPDWGDDNRAMNLAKAADKVFQDSIRMGMNKLMDLNVDLSKLSTDDIIAFGQQFDKIGNLLPDLTGLKSGGRKQDESRMELNKRVMKLAFPSVEGPKKGVQGMPTPRWGGQLPNAGMGSFLQSAGALTEMGNKHLLTADTGLSKWAKREGGIGQPEFAKRLLGVMTRFKGRAGQDVNVKRGDLLAGWQHGGVDNSADKMKIVNQLGRRSMALHEYTPAVGSGQERQEGAIKDALMNYIRASMRYEEDVATGADTRPQLVGGTGTEKAMGFSIDVLWPLIQKFAQEKLGVKGEEGMVGNPMDRDALENTKTFKAIQGFIAKQTIEKKYDMPVEKFEKLLQEHLKLAKGDSGRTANLSQYPHRESTPPSGTPFSATSKAFGQQEKGFHSYIVEAAKDFKLSSRELFDLTNDPKMKQAFFRRASSLPEGVGPTSPQALPYYTGKKELPAPGAAWAAQQARYDNVFGASTGSAVGAKPGGAVNFFKNAVKDPKRHEASTLLDQGKFAQGVKKVELQTALAYKENLQQQKPATPEAQEARAKEQARVGTRIAELQVEIKFIDDFVKSMNDLLYRGAETAVKQLEALKSQNKLRPQ